jgi:hypothetical protein
MFKYKSPYLTRAWLVLHNDVDILKRMKLHVRCHGNVKLRKLSSLSFGTAVSLFCFLLVSDDDVRVRGAATRTTFHSGGKLLPAYVRACTVLCWVRFPNVK